MPSDRAPVWFREKMAEATGHAAPLSERELATMITPIDRSDSIQVRAVAEIIRLREQLKTIIHAAPRPRGRKTAARRTS